MGLKIARKGDDTRGIIPMPGAILSFLGGWWARWFGRAGDSHVSYTEAIEELEKAQAAAPEVVAGSVATTPKEPAADRAAEHEANRRAAEQSFLETVKMTDASPTRRTSTTANPDVRNATLEALQGLKQIPALQSLVQGVTRIMTRDGVDVDEIVEALQKDSALCVRVLSMANSVYVASEQKVVDLQTAVQLLGIARIRRLAQAVFTLRDSQRMVEGLDWRHLWIHALATAAIAEELERRLRPNPSSQIYMAALLHDVGKIVLSTVAGDTYREIIVASWNGEGRLEDIERETLGVGHREAGVIFATGNQLSDVVIESIAHHDDPSKAGAYRLEVSLVSLANFISKARGLGFSGARLDVQDGEVEDLPAWKVLAEELGWQPNLAQLDQEMADFYTALRNDLLGLREQAD
jgi:putative nucleotidyltransferase with HDIG domain